MSRDLHHGQNIVVVCFFFPSCKSTAILRRAFVARDLDKTASFYIEHGKKIEKVNMRHALHSLCATCNHFGTL